MMTGENESSSDTNTFAHISSSMVAASAINPASESNGSSKSYGRIGSSPDPYGKRAYMMHTDASSSSLEPLHHRCNNILRDFQPKHQQTLL